MFFLQLVVHHVTSHLMSSMNGTRRADVVRSLAIKSIPEWINRLWLHGEQAPLAAGRLWDSYISQTAAGTLCFLTSSLCHLVPSSANSPPPPHPPPVDITALRQWCRSVQERANSLYLVSFSFFLFSFIIPASPPPIKATKMNYRNRKMRRYVCFKCWNGRMYFLIHFLWCRQKAVEDMMWSNRWQITELERHLQGFRRNNNPSVKTIRYMVHD